VAAWSTVLYYLLVFFFQAEDGIRDFHVTGVQTCALPICNLSQRNPARFLLTPVEEKEILAVRQKRGLQFLGCLGGEHRLLVDRIVDNLLSRVRVLNRVVPNVSVAHSHPALCKRVRSTQSTRRVGVLLDVGEVQLLYKPAVAAGQQPPAHVL